MGMEATEIIKLLRVRPFEPFRIHMTDGRSFDIDHPELSIVTRRKMIIGVGANRESGISDHTENCSLIHVVRVEELRG